MSHFINIFPYVFHVVGGIALVVAVQAVLRERRINAAKRTASQIQPISVRFDDSEIRIIRNGTEQEKVVWEEVARILISIEDDYLPIPYWYIGGGAANLRIPNDADGIELLLDEFKSRLPGYDCDDTYGAIIRAMGAMDGFFFVWMRSAHEGSAR